MNLSGQLSGSSVTKVLLFEHASAFNAKSVVDRLEILDHIDIFEFFFTVLSIFYI